MYVKCCDWHFKIQYKKPVQLLFNAGFFLLCGAFCLFLFWCDDWHIVYFNEAPIKETSDEISNFLQTFLKKSVPYLCMCVCIDPGPFKHSQLA